MGLESVDQVTSSWAKLLPIPEFLGVGVALWSVGQRFAKRGFRPFSGGIERPLARYPKYGTQFASRHYTAVKRTFAGAPDDIPHSHHP